MRTSLVAINCAGVTVDVEDGEMILPLMIEKGHAMEWQDKYTYGLWGAAAGAVALAIVGFALGGWYTTGGARRLAVSAVETALIPVCVKDVMADATAAAELKVKRTNDYDDVVRDYLKRIVDSPFGKQGYQFNRACGAAIEKAMPPTTATKS